MKKILTTLCLALSVSALSLSAQDAAPADQAAAPAEEANWDLTPPQVMPINGSYAVYVSTVDGMKANMQYERNMQAMRQQFQVIQSMEVTINATEDDTLKESLKKELDAKVEKFKEDQKKMADAYNVGIQYQYVSVPVKAHVYRMLTNEELQKIAEQQKKAQEEKPAGGSSESEAGSLISQ